MAEFLATPIDVPVPTVPEAPALEIVVAELVVPAHTVPAHTVPARTKPRRRSIRILMCVVVAVVIMRVVGFIAEFGARAYREMTAVQFQDVRPRPQQRAAVPAGEIATEDSRLAAKKTPNPPGFYPDEPAWGIPIPSQLPPVFVEDYEPADLPPENDDPQRTAATARLREADRLKWDGDYTAAESSYLEVLRLQPDSAIASYQLACNYALAGKVAEASESFDRACEMGFAEYVFCYDDEELGSVRTQPDFKDKLRGIRERFQAIARQRVRAPAIFRPAGEPPTGGWQVIVLLHGYGDTHESYFEEARAWAESGVLAIAMPGLIPLNDGFIWPLDDVTSTHAAIQQVLADPLLDNLMDRTKRVNLLGFSQGAIHALQIHLLNLDKYRGLVSISPGGRPWILSDIDSDSSVHESLVGVRKGRAWLIAGKQEDFPRRLHETLEKILSERGWRIGRTEHDGGHEFPDDWEELRPQLIQFITAPPR